GEVEADEERRDEGEDGIDQPLAQFEQVIEQRRLGRLDRVFVFLGGGRHDAGRPASGDAGSAGAGSAGSAGAGLAGSAGAGSAGSGVGSGSAACSSGAGPDIM